MVAKCRARTNGCNDADEVSEVVDFVGSASHCKHVMAHVLNVVYHPVVGMPSNAATCFRSCSYAPQYAHKGTIVWLTVL